MISAILLTVGVYLVTSSLFVHISTSLAEIAVIFFSSIGLGLFFRITIPVIIDTKKNWIILPGSYINLFPTFALIGISYYLSYLRLTEQEFFSHNTGMGQLLYMAVITTMCIWIVMNLVICYQYITGNFTTENGRNR